MKKDELSIDTETIQEDLKILRGSKKAKNIVFLSAVAMFAAGVFLLTTYSKPYDDLYWKSGKVVEVKRTVVEHGLLSSSTQTPIKVLLSDGQTTYTSIYLYTNIFEGMTAYQKFYVEDGVTYKGDVRIHTRLSHYEKNTLKKLNKPTNLLSNLKD